jgi:hypothetical protein
MCATHVLNVIKYAAVCDESLRMVAAKRDDANALHRLRKNTRELR